jgi:Tfp pilus assembly protein PilF
MSRASCLMVLGRAQEALESVERALLVAPRVAASHVVRAMVLRQLGRDRDAREALLEALRLDPQNADAARELSALEARR